ncbi:type IV pilus biogenesis protein PilP [Pseudomonas oryzihabitans]|uniref:type IV pilus biogenesis protein PilP n=1 Tax=Pseudomonas oryzihabitans TaxID=47885 RepID=UPI002895F32B|nr:type IV pilus biogenesis protein PilP [Pseudomonas oryzihabitans]MDT3723180.1 type IV pilus biogenesis protein PilP [Pseudomonas oryzihabitans]
MSNDLSLAAIGALMLTLAVPAWADATKQGDPDGITVGELSRVQSETILYKAQGERAKALREISGTSTQATTSPLPSYLSQPVVAPISRVSGAAEQTGAVEQLPVVKLVYGAGKALHATLLYAGGFEIDASLASSDLPGGYRVASLSLDSVVLSRGGKRYPLGFSNRAPSFPVASVATSQAPVLPVTVTPMNPVAPVPVPAPTPIALPGSAPTANQP